MKTVFDVIFYTVMIACLVLLVVSVFWFMDSIETLNNAYN